MSLWRNTQISHNNLKIYTHQYGITCIELMLRRSYIYLQNTWKNMFKDWKCEERIREKSDVCRIYPSSHCYEAFVCYLTARPILNRRSPAIRAPWLDHISARHQMSHRWWQRARTELEEVWRCFSSISEALGFHTGGTSVCFVHEKCFNIKNWIILGCTLSNGILLDFLIGSFRLRHCKDHNKLSEIQTLFIIRGLEHLLHDTYMLVFIHLLESRLKAV